MGGLAIKNKQPKLTPTFSNEEKVVGTWIDGRPIYQRSFVINGNDGDSVLTTDSDIDFIVNYAKMSIIYHDDVFSHNELAQICSPTYISWRLMPTPTVELGGVTINYDFITTLEYTKRSDFI